MGILGTLILAIIIIVIGYFAYIWWTGKSVSNLVDWKQNFKWPWAKKSGMMQIGNESLLVGSSLLK